jgi:hypothetical protein
VTGVAQRSFVPSETRSLNLSITNASMFGDYSALLTNPRTMQFALRYEF